MTDRQILGAKIRAAAEAFIKKHQKPYMGGYEIPTNKEKYEHLSKLFGLSPLEISYFMTYSRVCTHEWSEGACPSCPD